jgi:hypothetical protein
MASNPSHVSNSRRASGAGCARAGPRKAGRARAAPPDGSQGGAAARGAAQAGRAEQQAAVGRQDDDRPEEPGALAGRVRVPQPLRRGLHVQHAAGRGAGRRAARLDRRLHAVGLPAAVEPVRVGAAVHAVRVAHLGGARRGADGRRVHSAGLLSQSRQRSPGCLCTLSCRALSSFPATLARPWALQARRVPPLSVSSPAPRRIARPARHVRQSAGGAGALTTGLLSRGVCAHPVRSTAVCATPAQLPPFT